MLFGKENSISNIFNRKSNSTVSGQFILAEEHNYANNYKIPLITLPEIHKLKGQTSIAPKEEGRSTIYKKQQASSEDQESNFLVDVESFPGDSKSGLSRASKITERSSKKRNMIRHFPPIECQLSLLPNDLLIKLADKRKHGDCWDDDLKNAVKKFKMDNNFPLKRKVRIWIAPGEYIILPRFYEKGEHKPWCPLMKPVTCTHKKPVTSTRKKPVTCTYKRHDTQTVGSEAPDSVSDSQIDAVSLPRNVPSTSTLFDSDLEIDDKDLFSGRLFDLYSETDDDFLPTSISDSNDDDDDDDDDGDNDGTLFAKQVSSDAVFVPPASPPWSMPNDLRDRLMQNTYYQSWDEELKEAVREFKLKRKFPLEKTVRIRIAPETYITLPGFPEKPQRRVNSARKAKSKSIMKTKRQLLKMKKQRRWNLKRKYNRR